MSRKSSVGRPKEKYADVDESHPLLSSDNKTRWVADITVVNIPTFTEITITGLSYMLGALQILT